MRRIFPEKKVCVGLVRVSQSPPPEKRSFGTASVIREIARLILSVEQLLNLYIAYAYHFVFVFNFFIHFFYFLLSLSVFFKILLCCLVTGKLSQL